VGIICDFIPILALLAIFGTYVGILGNPLTAAVAFTTVALVDIMRKNVRQMGMMSRHTTSAWISMQRLDRYFENTTPLNRFPSGPLRLQDATFRRNKRADFRLQKLSIDFVEGGLNVVMGQSGSGKTTLLLSVLGETVLESGIVTCPPDVAFASQTPWLSNATIKENILFHGPFEQARYDRVIEACCLPVDFAELTNGDMTEAGENGTSLSGGQKSRVALARALYSKAPLLLLDDIFSALDSKTSASLWDLVFCSDLLQGRTVVLVANLPWVAAQADLAVTLENGLVKSLEQNLGIKRTPVILKKDADEQEDGDLIDPPEGSGASKISEAKPPSPSPEHKKDDIKMEMTASGGSGRMMVFQYLLYFGGPLYAFLAIFTSVLANVAFIASSLWLSVWVDAYTKEQAVSVGYYLGIYTLFSANEAITDLVVFITYANGSWRAAKALHEMFVRAVMNVSLAWYRNVPVGRVVNRFSRDLSALDTNLNRVVSSVIEEAIKVLFRIGAVTSILPIFMLPALIACTFGIAAGEMYTRTAVVVKRLVSSSQSPVFSQFSDTLAGLAVIRARADMPTLLGDQLAARLREFSRASQASYNCNRWIAVKIDFITACIMLCAGMLAISKAGVLSAALVGFSLSNATGLGNTILGMVRAMNEMEVELQSVSDSACVLNYPTAVRLSN